MLRVFPSLLLFLLLPISPSVGQEESTLDLRPSFSKRLPYSQVCGVVVCQSDTPLSGLQSTVDEITQLQVDLKKYLAIPEANQKIELCVFSTEKAYRSFLEHEFPGAPKDRRALYVKKDGPGIVLLQRTDDFEIDLRHEMTHAIIHASIESVPIWLDEGLAKYFEPRPEERAFHNPYLGKVRFAARFGSVPSLERLEKLENISEMDDIREYRESWAWIHYLLHGSPQTHRLLAGYLQLLAQADGKKPLPKLAPLLRKTVNGPVADYKRHYKSWAE